MYYSGPTSSTRLQKIIHSFNGNIVISANRNHFGSQSTALESTIWTNSGIAFKIDTSSYFDISPTSSTGELAANSFGSPIFSASYSKTYTDISTVYISSDPITGTSSIGYVIGPVTYSNSYSLKVNSGDTLLGGGLKYMFSGIYPDNTSAITAGLTYGDVYTDGSGTLKIVHI